MSESSQAIGWLALAAILLVAVVAGGVRAHVEWRRFQRKRNADFLRRYARSRP